jgi:hypothetical protein
MSLRALKLFMLIAAIASVLPLFAHASVTLIRPANSSGLLAYWSFDSTTVSGSSVSDLSGNGKTMTLSGTTNTSGKAGQARSYNGSSDYGVANLGTQPSSITTNVWFRANSTADQALVDFQDSASPVTGYHMTVLGIYGGSLYASYWNIANLTGPAISAGQWYMATLTYDNATGVQNLYLNGTLVGSNTGTWGGPGTLYFYLAQQQQSCSFNSNCGVNANFFNGAIDEVRVYNRALTAAEVRALYGGTTKISTSNATTLKSGLVGYWPLDGNTTNWTTGKTQDLSGNGNTGQLLSMSTTTSPVIGKIGQALNFTGSNSVSNPVVTTAVQDVSMSAWVYWRGITTVAQILFFNGDTGANGYGIIIANGSSAGNKIQILIGGKVYNALSSSPTLPTGQWVHLAIVNSSGMWTLYVNGTAQATGNTGGTPNTPSNGAGASNIGSLFNGAIDDARIYNRALSASEVVQLYGQGSAIPSSSNTNNINSGLVGYWTMDGSSINWTTNFMADKSGQGNVGQLVSIPTTTAPVTGKVGQALNFAASGQKVTGSVSTPSASYAVSAWIRYRGPTPISAIKVALAYGPGGGNGTLWMGYASDGSIAISSSAFDIKNASISNDSKWHFVVGSVSGGTLTGYVDGVSIGTTAMSSRGSSALVAGDYPGGGFAFPGSVDDVRVYNRPLTANEVVQLYKLAK